MLTFPSLFMPILIDCKDCKVTVYCIFGADPLLLRMHNKCHANLNIADGKTRKNLRELSQPFLRISISTFIQKPDLALVEPIMRHGSIPTASLGYPDDDDVMHILSTLKPNQCNHMSQMNGNNAQTQCY